MLHSALKVSLTSLHVEHKVLAMLPGLLSILLQLTPFT